MRVLWFLWSWVRWPRFMCAQLLSRWFSRRVTDVVGGDLWISGQNCDESG